MAEPVPPFGVDVPTYFQPREPTARTYRGFWIPINEGVHIERTFADLYR
jgi:hypothetical protein